MDGYLNWTWLSPVIGWLLLAAAFALSHSLFYLALGAGLVARVRCPSRSLPRAVVLLAKKLAPVIATGVEAAGAPEAVVGDRAPA